MPLPPIFNVKLNHPNAVFPTKAHSTDVGFDVSIVAKDTDLSKVVALYDTGISITPSDDSYDNTEFDFYIEVVPRSSLAKSGYMLANSIGIIDPEYQGNVKVALVKIDPNAPELTLPFTAVQLIVRRAYSDTILQQVTEDPRRATARGDGGFGSTNPTSQNKQMEMPLQISTPSRRTPRS